MSMTDDDEPTAETTEDVAEVANIVHTPTKQEVNVEELYEKVMPLAAAVLK